MTKKIIALIVAGGSGLRMNAALPKQYLKIDNQTILRLTIEKFLSHPQISAVQVVINQEHLELYNEATAGLELLPVCYGGVERQDSVRLGLEAIHPLFPDLVLIHDAARPFVSHQLISNVISELETEKAVIPGIRSINSVKKVVGSYMITTLNRAELYNIQTPQAFEYQLIYSAHQAKKISVAEDDAAVLQACDPNVQIKVIPGEDANIKITTNHDLEKFKMQLTRIGSGFDAHRFSGEPGFVILGGIKILHNKTIIAHSDGDLVLHALTDALLGTIAAGDIGQHFPPSDERWKNCDSAEFVRHAHSLIQAKGGQIVNIDITIICERPKVGPYRQQIQESIANILGLQPDQVSVKATTTEKMGFTGREEGIAAQAVASMLI
jgi:2-C-methyl-D-erythritol 4-phosphate cytidylyltransferase/2-C-methyl-D-erythritol 2,4-cyclodiphosphate synthase